MEKIGNGMKTTTFELKETRVTNLTKKLLQTSWNRTSLESSCSKILEHIHTEEGLFSFVYKENEKSFVYMREFFEIFSQICDLISIDENPQYFRSILEPLVAKQFPTLYENYTILRNSGRTEFLNAFNSDFRGKIIDVHNTFNRKYCVIETESKGERFFYGGNNLSYQFGSFEEALIHEMCPTFSNAICSLYLAHEVLASMKEE